MASGFSSFVAWRYLMARPRRASASILGFTALAAWVALEGTLAALLFPLSHPYLPPPLPVGLLLGACAGLAAVPVATAAGLIHATVFDRAGRIAPFFLHAAALGVLVAAAVLGLHARALDAGGLVPVLEAAPAPLYVLAAPGVLALLAGAAYALVGALRAVGRVETSAGMPALYAIAWALAVLQLLPLAALGLRDELLPSLADSAPGVLAAGALALGILGGLAAVLGLRRITGRGRGRGARGLALLALLVLAGLLGWVWIASGFEAWREALAFGIRQAPMWMTMPAIIAGALAALALVLAAVRYVFTFFTTVSIGGVCIGSMALVIVLSVMSGFETDLRDKILGSNAHILVTQKDGTFSEYRDVAAALSEVPEVVGQTPYLETEVVISARGNYANVIIKGIDTETVGEVTDLDENAGDDEVLAKLWPLAEDGEVIGRPQGDGAPEEPAPDEGGEPEPAGEIVDPVPEDLDVGAGDPIDFSGAASASTDGGDGVDRAPDDLDVGTGAPRDFSGSGADAGPGEDPGDTGAPGPPPPVPGSRPDMDPLDPRPGVGAEPWDPAADDLGDPLGGDPYAGLDMGAFGEGAAIAPEVATLPGVLVGRELVKQVPMQEGDEVMVVSPLREASPDGPVPRTRRYRVAGEFYTGMYEYDLKYVYVTLPSLQTFMDAGDEVSGIEVRIKDPSRSGEVLPEIAAAIGDAYDVADWRELNKSLFSALKLEKIAMFLVLAIIILVASFSIIGNLVMVVIEKAKEIALLKTLGAGDGGVMKVFIVQGFFIGLVGTALGVTLGLVVCALGIIYGLPLDPDVYYIDQLPIHVEAGSVVAVGLAGILISVVATLYPAYVAARLRPVEGLRYE